MFKALGKLGFNDSFCHMIKSSLERTNTFVYINKTLTNYFPIERRIRQGCKLAPYLFIMIGEVFKTTI